MAEFVPIRSCIGDREDAARSGIRGLSCRRMRARSAAGREPEDYDVATSATPDVVLDMFPRTFAVGAHFGVVLVASEIGRGCEDGAVEERCVTEVATFRSDGVYSDGRHPDEVRYTKTAAEDVQRRDFTINGLLLDPLRGASRSILRLLTSASIYRWRAGRSGCGRDSRHWSAGEAL